MSVLDDFLDASIMSDSPSHLISGITKPIQISSIPRRVMQCGYNKKHIKYSKESIDRYIPSWDYIYFDHNDARVYIREHYPHHVDIYDALKDDQKDDLFTYLWLHRNGGLVLDPDFEILKPIDDLFYNEAELYLAMSPDNNSMIITSFIASKPHCQFWLDIVNRIRSSKRSMLSISPHLERKKRTGESLISSQLPKCRHQYIMISPAILNPNGFCYTCRGGFNGSEDSYIRRIDGSLGTTIDEVTINIYKCYKDYILYVFISIVVIVIIFCISMSYMKRSSKVETFQMGYQGIPPVYHINQSPMGYQGLLPNNQLRINHSPKGGYPFIGYY